MSLTETVTTITPLSMNASRRSMIGGAALALTAAALAISSTTDAAASVPDCVVQPDADLIRLCSEVVALELQWRTLYDGPNAVGDADEAEARAALIHAQIDAMMDGMKALRATSAAGVLARAHALAIMNGDFASSFDDPETHPGCLLECLLRDAAAIGERA